MPRTIFGILFVVLISSPVVAQIFFDAQVVRVTDGDTIAVRAGDTTFRIRLYGIDAPESGQNFGTDSTAALRSLLGYVAGRSYPEIQIQVLDLDRYGRMVSKILKDEVDLNLQMIRNGFAWHYREYDDTAEYAQAQEQARREGLGLWGTEDPIAPWEWRSQ